jgi:hypothetical protein
VLIDAPAGAADARDAEAHARALNHARAAAEAELGLLTADEAAAQGVGTYTDRVRGLPDDPAASIHAGDPAFNYQRAPSPASPATTTTTRAPRPTAAAGTAALGAAAAVAAAAADRSAEAHAEVTAHDVAAAARRGRGPGAAPIELPGGAPPSQSPPPPPALPRTVSIRPQAHLLQAAIAAGDTARVAHLVEYVCVDVSADDVALAVASGGPPAMVALLQGYAQSVAAHRAVGGGHHGATAAGGGGGTTSQLHHDETPLVTAAAAVAPAAHAGGRTGGTGGDDDAVEPPTGGSGEGGSGGGIGPGHPRRRSAGSGVVLPPKPQAPVVAASDAVAAFGVDDALAAAVETTLDAGLGEHVEPPPAEDVDPAAAAPAGVHPVAQLTAAGGGGGDVPTPRLGDA